MNRSIRWPRRAAVSVALAAPLAAALAFGASVAGAQDPPTAPPKQPAAEPSPTPAKQRPLVVSVFPQGQLDEVALRQAIEAELGRTVSAAAEPGIPYDELLVELSEAKIRAVFRNPDGQVVERVIPRPAAEELVETVTLLAGNLARDEAAELLEEMGPAEPPGPSEEELPGEPAPRLPSTADKPDSHKRPQAESPEPPTADGPAEPDDAPLPPLKPTVVQLSLFYPVAVMPDAEDRWAAFALGTVYGRVGSLYGLGVDGVVGMVDRELYGVHVGGVWTHLADHTAGLVVAGVGASSKAQRIEGLLIAGAASVNLGDEARLRGLQMAGALAYHGGPLQGAQVAGAVNLAPLHDVPFYGAQVSGAVNVAADGAGLQATTGVNVADDLKGAQVAMAMNLADDLQGAQLGTLNVADDVTGAQLGLINVGQRVTGAQVGLVNVADEVDEGTQIGLVSTGADVQAASWVTTDLTVHLGVKSVVNYVHTIASLGYRPLVGERRVEPQLTVGGHLPLGDFFGEIEIGWIYPVLVDEDHESQHELHHRLVAGWQPTEWFGVFVSGGVRQEMADQDVSAEGAAGILLF